LSGQKQNIPINPDVRTLSDDDIIELILGTGKSEYFGILYDRYANKVYGKCLQMVKETNTAQDLSHDILIKVFTKLNTFKGKSSFSTWIYQISYTHCIDYLRKSKKQGAEELTEEKIDKKYTNEKDGVNEKVLLEMKLEKLQELMDRIKPEEKALLLMKYQDKVPITELAEQYSLSESAVKMKLKRVRDRIRSMYEADLRKEET
jgi:RNA polymerase sigma factor (sigma-70 family)